VKANHESDQECAPFLDEDGWCSECGASRPEEPCAACGGYAYHRPECPTPDEVSDE